MADSKHAAVWNWLMQCPHVGDLFFNLSDGEIGSTKLIPSESVLQTYIDGSTVRNYDCALTRFEACTLDPNDDMNIESLRRFELLAEWIEEQAEKGNFPQFPEGQTVQEITVLTNEGGFMALQEMDICKFMLQFRIEYLKSKSTFDQKG